MTTVRFGSCDAEARWRPDDLANLPALRDPHAARLLRAMDELQAVLCGPDDVLLTDRQPTRAFTEVMHAAGHPGRHLAVPGDPEATVEERLAALDPDGPAALPELAGAAAAPYAVLPGTRAAARRLRLSDAGLPEESAVVQVNSKTWSTGLDLPGSGTVVTSLTALRRAAGAPCVVKDPFGVSGQGNIVVDSPARLDLVERHLARDGRRIELVVQPLFTRAEDFSAHLTVGSGGRLQWHGIRQVRNDGHAYRGSTAPRPELLRLLERSGYRDTVESVATAAAAAGYRGPLSVDSMTTTCGQLIPVIEVNARLSPGFIAQLLGIRLELRVLPVRRADAFERLVQRLDEAGLLAVSGRPGILPLTAGTLQPPRGWLFHAVIGDPATEPDLDPLLDTLV